jgi:hypothetical protein
VTAFVRAAAAAAGLVGSADSPRLLLVRRPEAAAVASILQSAPAVRAAMALGTKMVVVDCGGGTVDIMVSKIKSTAPLQLAEILPPSGGPWGATNVDARFMSFVEQLLGAGTFHALEDAAKMELLDSWAGAKVRQFPGL